MLILLLCILINGLIGVIFKLFGKFNVNILQAIIINYFICVVSGSIFSGQYNLVASVFETDWWPIALFLGLLFIIVFNAYANAVNVAGVGISTLFQKMSLIAPVIVAVLFFNDSLSLIKVIGLALSIASLFLLSLSKSDDQHDIKKGLSLLLLVFVGSCMIDVMLYLVEVNEWAPGADVGFVSSLFMFAMFFGLGYLFTNKNERKKPWTSKSMIAGILLGIPNFFSIYLLLKVIAEGWEASVVFPSNNVGVLTIAAIAGVLFFNERLTTRKLIGFSSAILAIILFILNAWNTL